MNVLITSGGTKVKIDLVRSITNMSTGTFGCKILDSLKEYAFSYKEKINITFLGAVGSKFEYDKDSKNYYLIEKKETYHKYLNCDIRVVPYVTYDDYRNTLKTLCEYIDFDHIILAAAVSDYGVDNYVDGKIRSTEDQMTIKLIKLPKLINNVLSWSKNKCVNICGFKLLVDSTKEQLKDACIKQANDNNVDFVVGNDLSDIKNDNHQLLIYDKKFNQFYNYSKDQSTDRLYLSNKVIQRIFRINEQ